MPGTFGYSGAFSPYFFAAAVEWKVAQAGFASGEVLLKSKQTSLRNGLGSHLVGGMG